MILYALFDVFNLCSRSDISVDSDKLNVIMNILPNPQTNSAQGIGILYAKFKISSSYNSWVYHVRTDRFFVTHHCLPILITVPLHRVNWIFKANFDIFSSNSCWVTRVHTEKLDLNSTNCPRLADRPLTQAHINAGSLTGDRSTQSRLHCGPDRLHNELKWMRRERER